MVGFNPGIILANKQSIRSPNPLGDLFFAMKKIHNFVNSSGNSTIFAVKISRYDSSIHYEVLKGDKAGISSIRVNDQYRIEFTATSDGEDAIVTICSILELSNHYK